MPETHVRITAKRSWLDFGLRDLWQFRDLAQILAFRDIKLRYRQTALGVIGVVLQPILTAGVLTFVFGRVADLPSEDVPYFALAFAGFTGWNLFSNIVLRSTTSLVSNASLVSKIYVPRLSVPIASVIVVLFDVAVTALLLVGTLVAYRIAPTVDTLFVPLWLIGILGLGLGLGAAAGALMVHKRDVITGVGAALQAMMYLTPVAYSSVAVPESVRSFYRLNPMATYLEGFRWSLLGTGFPGAGRIVVAAAFTVVALFGGLAIFGRLERGLADVI